MSKLYLAQPRVHAVLGETGVESAHIIPLWDGVTVRVGVPQGDDMAEEDFEGRWSADFQFPILRGAPTAQPHTTFSCV